MIHIKIFDDYVNEGRSRYDGLVSKLTRIIFKEWVDGFADGLTVIGYDDLILDGGLEFEILASLHIDSKYGDLKIMDTTGVDARDVDDEGDEQTPYIVIDFAIDPKLLPFEWSNIYYNLADVIRHEMEHITQDGVGVGNYRAGKPSIDDSEIRGFIESGLLPKSRYMTLPKEVDANLQGFRYVAKKRRIPMIDVINSYLDMHEKDGIIDGNEREEILGVWKSRAKKIGGFPDLDKV